MKKLIIAAALMAAAAAPAMAQTAVSISVGQPNFFGRIDLGGGYAPPPVVYAQPVIVERTRYVGQPVYLRVPEGHRKHWNKHCREYNACGQQVFFVQDGWYSNTYAPRYREQHYREQGPRGPVGAMIVREGRENSREERRDYDRRDDRRDERHEDRHDDDHGHGNGHGKGHDKHGD